MVLSDQEIEMELRSGRLVISPEVTDAQIGPSSVDLHLSDQFTVFKKETDLAGLDITVDLANVGDSEGIIRVLGEETTIAEGDGCVIRPGEFVLAYTRERIQMPRHLAARVEGRSTLARFGLSIHQTAPTVHATSLTPAPTSAPRPAGRPQPTRGAAQMSRLGSAINAFKFDKRIRLAIRPRFSADLLVTLIGFIPFAVSVWYLDLVSSFRDQVLATILYGMIPLLLLSSASAISPSPRRPSKFVLMAVGALLVACGIRAIVEFGPTALRNAFTILLVTSPLLYAFAVIFRRTLVAVALVPPMIIALGYLIIAALPEGERLNLFLFPLPLVLVVSLPWAIFAWLSLKAAERSRKAVIWGPATEALAMLVLFLPTITLSVLVPVNLGLDQMWLAVSVTIVGILFSSIVSVPLRQFLLDLGDLPPNERWKG